MSLFTKMPDLDDVVVDGFIYRGFGARIQYYVIDNGDPENANGTKLMLRRARGSEEMIWDVFMDQLLAAQEYVDKLGTHFTFEHGTWPSDPRKIEWLKIFFNGQLLADFYKTRVTFYVSEIEKALAELGNSYDGEGDKRIEGYTQHCFNRMLDILFP